MKTSGMLLWGLVIVGLFLSIASKSIYDFKTSDVSYLTNLNFQDQILKIRDKTNYVSIVQFYRYDDGKSLNFVPEFNKWTSEYKGVFRIGAVDCDDYPVLCQKQGVDLKKTPVFKIYPANPIPVYQYQGELKVDQIQKVASKYLHSNVIEITNTNIKTFLGQNPSVPKVLLFTDKKGVPMIYKGLSVEFQKKLNFGIVRETDTILVDRYAIKTFPTVIVLKTGEAKPHFFKGKEFNFASIFQFLNIYSEVFVPGGGSSLDSSATKQWMTQIFPEMNHRSAKDICLDLEGSLCVILLTKTKPSKELERVFEELNTKFDTKMDRGIKFKFMWLNVQIEKAWATVFAYTGTDKVVVLNPGKRKRYTDHEGEILKDRIAATLDAIVGGDARFNRVSEVPSFQIRTD